MIPARTARTAPSRKPPPMKKLTIAVGKITKADITLKFSSIRIIAPSNMRPSMIPRMKPKLPRKPTQGSHAVHTAKKDGHSSAIALAKINAAPSPTKKTGNQRDLNPAKNGPIRYGVRRCG
jgi:hypothetical protein